MDKMISLLKVSFINSIGINALSKNIDTGKEKKRYLLSLGMMAIFFILFVAMSFGYGYGISEVLEQINRLDFLLVFAILVTTLAVTFLYIYKAPGVLFSCKDYDLLMSLPIKNTTVLASKILEMVVFSWIITAIIMIPMSVIYYIKSGNTSILFFIMMVVGIIFIPMIPIVIASFLAIIISYLASKSKNKSLITIILNLVLFLAIMYGSINIQSGIEYFEVNGNDIVNTVSRIYLPALYLKNAMVDGSIVDILRFILLSLIPFLALVFIFSKSFNNIHRKLSETTKKANYKLGELKTRSRIKALTIEEIKRYFSISIYVINTAIGMIIALLCSIATLVKGQDVFGEILEGIDIYRYLSIGVLIIMIFCIGLSCTTVCSISLEGNKLWIKKSLPVRIKEIFLSKIYTNLIITVPISILANIIFFIALKFDIIYLLLNIAITIIYAVFSAVLGLFINLLFPKMQWTNPTLVVKQSTSVFINILIIFISMAIPVIVLVVFNIENILLLLIGIMLALMILTVVVWEALMNKGIEKFKML